MRVKVDGLLAVHHSIVMASKVAKRSRAVAKVDVAVRPVGR